VPDTAQGYTRRWREAMDPSRPTTKSIGPWTGQLSPTSAILFESSRALPNAGWCAFFANFGDAICHYRYGLIPQELERAPALLTSSVWTSYRAQFGATEIRRRRYEGERALDRLLEHFVAEGYQSGMGQKLIEIVGETLLDYELRSIYVLPTDLNALLASIGNPLISCDLDDEDADVSAMPAFDLNSPGHRELLADLLVPSGR
jgi:hypothetical protein